MKVFLLIVGCVALVAFLYSLPLILNKMFGDEDDE